MFSFFCVAIYNYKFIFNLCNFLNSFICFCVAKASECVALATNFDLKYLALIWIIFIVVGLVFNLIGYIIISIENEIKIDLSKIKGKYLRISIENFIGIQKSKTIDKEKYLNYLFKHIILCIVLLFGAMLLIII